MITPKEFELEQKNFQSEQYAKGLEVAEAVSEKMRLWAREKKLSHLFENGGFLKIDKKCSNDTDLVISDPVIRDIVFEEFKRAGWEIYLGKKEECVLLRPMPKPRTWWQKITDAITKYHNDDDFPLFD